MIKVIKGDLIKLAKQGNFDMIAHGANCFLTFGAGIARQIKVELPQAYEADKKTLKGDKNKLGSYSNAIISTDNNHQLNVVNCYTQYYYDSRDGTPLDYNALASSLHLMTKNLADKTTTKIGLPLIGYGLAGGDLVAILNIMYSILNDYNVTIVVFDKDVTADVLVDIVESFISLKDKLEFLK